ncbi:GDP-mannose 4,6-dehydratase [Geotalea uraniireducens]|uniref:NAD-dependent epimerase/dehydratase n=1 Tax=Geotalea uraniireducens (strain Rf4) TaxID=351605 RepID=A5G3W3_GEOUR|nr:GDP-mannose 4,6-dehydratase [Geotalea uraniireducens]ABQ26481.1 NAD-dependent epimerase/dehydratase [Geotalea uraniireducens Rf4]
MRILVTGGAGFIGSHLVERLISSGHDVVIIDNFNDFYDPQLKRRNFSEIVGTAEEGEQNLILCEGDIRDADFVKAVVLQESVDAVIHLAAAAGVRPSIENPLFYEEVNIRGTMNILEAARTAGVRFLLFASSSSVYGNSFKTPFSESDPVDHPISPYAATKKAGELICHTYHHLYKMNIACLRFFTVYGPRQRPDLAINKFTRLIDQGKAVPFYGDGTTSRDYTFINDIIAGVEKALSWVCSVEPRYDIFNLGGSRPVELSRLVEILESELGKKAILDRLPMQPGDVHITFADLAKSGSILGYQPVTSIEEGLRAFIRWYKENN